MRWGRLVLASVAVCSFASVAQAGVAHLVYAKDVTGTSYTYCKHTGAGGDPYASPIAGTGRIETSGSSTTVTAETAGDAPFTSVAVGDLLIITEGQNSYTRIVVTRTSATEITVNTALNITGAAWGWYDTSCGTGATDGWVDMEGAWSASFVVDVTTINATSVDYQVQCRVSGSNGVQLAAASLATATTGQYSMTAGTSGSWSECRMGLKLTNDGGAQVVSAYLSRTDLPSGSTFSLWNPQEVSGKTLTEGAATELQEISVPQTAGGNYADALVSWTAYATDGTEVQARRGTTYLAAVNAAGTETCTVGDVGTTVVAVSSGTLACTSSCVTGLTDVVRFALSCTSSLTQTSLEAVSSVLPLKSNTVTPQ